MGDLSILPHLLICSIIYLISVWTHRYLFCPLGYNPLFFYFDAQIISGFCFVIVIFFFFWLCSMACQILVPWRGIKPVSPAVEAWSPNYWAARQLPVPVLTSESLFKLSSVSFWYDLSLLRSCQESDTTEQLTDRHIAWCSSNLVLSQLQL